MLLRCDPIRFPTREGCCGLREGVLLVLCVFALLSVVGCGKPHRADAYVRPDQISDFEALYGKNCSGCHGKTGRFGPAPPLNDAMFQALISDQQLTSILTKGREGYAMPAFSKQHGGNLTPQQIQRLVAGIRKRWKTENKFDADVPLPSYTNITGPPQGGAKADVESGQKLFRVICNTCHGNEESGGAGNVAEHTGILSRSFGRLTSDQVLRRIIITGRPDLGMPNFIELGRFTPHNRPLTEQEIADIIAYMRSAQ